MTPFPQSDAPERGGEGVGGGGDLDGNKGDSYHRRNKNLINIGFENYGKYLSSPLWRDIRSKILIAGSCCVLCPLPATQVHHTRYQIADLLGNNLTQLHPICRDCHEKIELDEDGEKRWMKEARQLFDELLLARKVTSVAK